MRLLSRLLSAFVLFLFLSLSATAQALPKPTGYVSDLENLLTPRQEKELKEWLVNYYTAQNIEVFVATVKQPSHQYADKLLNYWRVGKPGLNNGLLLLINAKGQIGIGTGRLLSLYLTPADKASLAKKITAQHKDDLEKTLITSLSMIDQKVKENQKKLNASYRLPRLGKITVVIFFLSMLLLPWLGAILSRDRLFYGGGLVAILMTVITFMLVGWLPSLLVASFLIPLGFLLDILVTNNYNKAKKKKAPAWWAGGRWL